MKQKKKQKKNTWVSAGFHFLLFLVFRSLFIETWGAHKEAERERVREREDPGDVICS